MSTMPDNAIRTSAEDLLGRTVTAATLARAIQSADSAEGYVLAVVGPWGSGKTSILNLMQESLEQQHQAIIIKFNPWMFSGTEQLVDAFFHELAAQLRETGDRKFDKVATAVDQYSFLFSPLTLIPGAGSYFSRAIDFAKGLKKYAESKRPSVIAQRDQIRSLLAELESPIVVTVDDIDRLGDEEIRAIFKLVRLTGNFPNLVYVLAFDMERVVAALAAAGFDGKAYVEKIVQQGIRVPQLSTVQIASLLIEALNEALNEIDELPYFDQDRWQDILGEIILPLVRTMRDVRRFAAAVATAARDFSAEFNLTDVIALEAIQVFLGDKFELIAKSREVLTNTSDSTSPDAASAVIKLIDGGGDRTVTDVMTALVKRVFPLASRYVGGPQYGGQFGGQWLSQWLIARRLAHRDILAGYLEYRVPESVTELANASIAFSHIDDADGLANFLGSLDPHARASAIDALGHYESRFTESAVVPAATVLLNLAGGLPRTELTGLFGLQPSDIVRIRVRQLLRVIRGRSDAYNLVEDIMAGIASLSSKFELVKLAGNRENFGGEGVITETEAKELERQLSLAVIQAGPEDLAGEWNLLMMLSTLDLWDYDHAPAVVDVANSSLHRTLLLQAKSTVSSQMVGNRAVYRATRLHWDALRRAYGSDEALRRGFEAVEQSLTEPNDELAPLVELARRYLAGEVPDDD
jgi:energy-coupling factor transporter ATP-binding protein EcfA2